MNQFNYAEKYKKFDKAFLLTIPSADQYFIEKLAFQYHFTYQEFHQCSRMAKEIAQWDAGPLETLIKNSPENKIILFKAIESAYAELKNNKSYREFRGHGHLENKPIKTSFIEKPEAKILGRCPVASEKTLCCNLQTLDAVRNCGLDCSYCSIQTFTAGDEVIMDADFGKKLLSMQLNPDEFYHIGTGQSSDSLMWGNKEGILDDLFLFAKINPNVILEFKTKSVNIDYLLKNDFPKNIITTWSLNTQSVIENEEHRTASLIKRLEAARKIADKGRLVGFHFHPMIHYDLGLKDYKEVVEMVMALFMPEEVALISIGTITFTKKVINEIRSRDIKSKILQMPFIEVAGKYSYPDSIKEEMFSHLYTSFKPWHEKVFFYLCMEPAHLWPKVFGFKYADNLEFEKNMKKSYLAKINSLN